MLQAREVGAVLDKLNADGVTTSMLLTLDGAILACAGAAALPKSESAFAVVIANMWNATEACAYGAAAERGADGTASPPFVANDEGVDLMLFELESGRCSVSRLAGSFLACLCGGAAVDLAHLKLKHEALQRCIEPCLGEIEQALAVQ